MLTKTRSPKPRTTIEVPSFIVEAIFEELKLLRKELSFVLPQDDLKNYTRPEKIRSSYKKALKAYPPVSYGNY